MARYKRNERYPRDFHYNREERNDNKFRRNKRYEDGSRNYNRGVSHHNNGFGNRSKTYDNNTEGRYEQPGCSTWNNRTCNSNFASHSNFFDRNTEKHNKQPDICDNSSSLNGESVRFSSMFGRNNEERNGQPGCSNWANTSTHNNAFARVSTTFDGSTEERNEQPGFSYWNNCYNNPVSYNSNPTELTAEGFRGIPSAEGYEYQYQDKSFRNCEIENDSTHTDPDTMLYQRRNNSKADFFDTQGFLNKDPFLGQERPGNEFAPHSTLHRTLNDNLIIGESQKTYYQRSNMHRNKYHSVNNSKRNTGWNQKGPRISRSMSRRGERSTDNTHTSFASDISRRASRSRRSKSSAENTRTSLASDFSRSATRRRRRRSSSTDNIHTSCASDISRSRTSRSSADNTRTSLASDISRSASKRRSRSDNINALPASDISKSASKERSTDNTNASDSTKQHNNSESSGTNLIDEDKRTNEQQQFNSTIEELIINNSTPPDNLLALEQMQSLHNPQMSPKVHVINTAVLMEDTTNINLSSVDNPVQPVGENLNDSSSFEPFKTIDTSHSIIEDLLKKIPHVSSSSVHSTDSFDYDSILAQLNENASYTDKSEPNMQLKNTNVSPTHDSDVMQFFGEDMQFVSQDELFGQDVQPIVVLSIEENLNERNTNVLNTPPVTSPRQSIGDNLNENHIDCTNSTQNSSESHETHLINNDKGANSIVQDTGINLHSSPVENPVQPLENLSDSIGMDPIRKTQPEHDELDQNASSACKTYKKHKTSKLNVSHKRPKKAKLSRSKAAFKSKMLDKRITKKNKTNKSQNKNNGITWEISDLAFPATSPTSHTEEIDSSSRNVNLLKPVVINPTKNSNAQPLTDTAQSLTDNVQSLTDNAQSLTDNAQLPTDNAQPPTDKAQSPTDNAMDSSGSRENWMETISPIFLDLSPRIDPSYMDSAIDSELSEVWTENKVFPTFLDLTNSSTESHTDSTKEASREYCMQTVDTTANSSSPLTDKTMKLDKLMGEATSSNKTNHRRLSERRYKTDSKGIDDPRNVKGVGCLPESDHSCKKNFCKDEAQIDKKHICNKLSCHSMVAVPAYKCYACHCLCLSKEETRKHIKTVHHKNALNKMLKEMTGITPVSEQERIALCKIAFLIPASEEELIKLNDFYRTRSFTK